MYGHHPSFSNQDYSTQPCDHQHFMLASGAVFLKTVFLGTHMQPTAVWAPPAAPDQYGWPGCSLCAASRLLWLVFMQAVCAAHSQEINLGLHVTLVGCVQPADQSGLQVTLACSTAGCVPPADQSGLQIILVCLDATVCRQCRGCISSRSHCCGTSLYYITGGATCLLLEHGRSCPFFWARVAKAL